MPKRFLKNSAQHGFEFFTDEQYMDLLLVLVKALQTTMPTKAD